MEWLCQEKCNYDAQWETGQTFYNRTFSTSYYISVECNFFLHSVTHRHFEMAVFFSISNCKDCGKRRISSVNFAFTRMWTEYIANESNERERLVFVRLTKLRRSAQTKYERNGTQVLDAPNSQRCIVTSPRVSFQRSVTEVVVLRKFGRSFLWWWIYGVEIFASQRIFLFFIIRAWSFFTSHNMYVLSFHHEFFNYFIF